MKKSLGKLMGVAVLGLVVAVFAVPVGSAVAQTVGTSCSFAVSPTKFSSFPATTTVSGVAPAGSNVTVFSQTDVSKAPVVAAALVAAGDGSYSANILVNGPTTFTVNYSNAGNAYAAGCGDPLGVFAVTVLPVQAVTVSPVQVAGTSALAFTGSSNTPSIALIGMAAVVVGMALVVGVRRKARVRS